MWRAFGWASFYRLPPRHAGARDVRTCPGKCDQYARARDISRAWQHRAGKPPAAWIVLIHAQGATKPARWLDRRSNPFHFCSMQLPPDESTRLIDFPWVLIRFPLPLLRAGVVMPRWSHALSDMDQTSRWASFWRASPPVALGVRTARNASLASMATSAERSCRTLAARDAGSSPALTTRCGF